MNASTGIYPFGQQVFSRLPIGSLGCSFQSFSDHIFFICPYIRLLLTTQLVILSSRNVFYPGIAFYGESSDS